MAVAPVLVALPGLLVAASCVVIALRALRQGGPRAMAWHVGLLGTLALFAFLGWTVRPLVTDPSVAFGVGVVLLAWETLLHGVLLVFLAHLDSARGRWFGSRRGTWVVLGATAAWIAWVFAVPGAFIGRVGSLDGVPGLYRLDAGAAALPWAAAMVAVRVFALWVAVDVQRSASGVVAMWSRRLFVCSVGLFLGLFVLWLSNPVAIYVTGAPYLPGPARFALPLLWTAVLAVGLAVVGPLRRNPTR